MLFGCIYLGAGKSGQGGGVVSVNAQPCWGQGGMTQEGQGGSAASFNAHSSSGQGGTGQGGSTASGNPILGGGSGTFSCAH